MGGGHVASGHGTSVHVASGHVASGHVVGGQSLAQVTSVTPRARGDESKLGSAKQGVRGTYPEGGDDSDQPLFEVEPSCWSPGVRDWPCRNLSLTQLSNIPLADAASPGEYSARQLPYETYSTCSASSSSSPIRAHHPADLPPSPPHAPRQGWNRGWGLSLHTLLTSPPASPTLPPPGDCLLHLAPYLP